MEREVKSQIDGPINNHLVSVCPLLSLLWYEVIRGGGTEETGNYYPRGANAN